LSVSEGTGAVFPAIEVRETIMEIVLWLILLPLGGTGVMVWLYRMPEHGAVPSRLLVSWNRLLGEYHRFLRGRFLEPGEEECYRASLVAVRAHSVDRHVILAQRALCIVTGRRVMVENRQGLRVQILDSDIRAVRAQRDYDPRDGFSYWVVMERVGSLLHEPEGDIAPRCASQEQSQALYSAIHRTTAVAVRT
jgi:hypothetical protein